MHTLLFSVLLLTGIFIAGCSDHEHGQSQGHGHDTMAEGHGHSHPDDDLTIVVTHFTHASELFVEFPAFVVDRESPFAAHLTRLDTFKPVAAGTVTVTLRGGGVPDEVFVVDAPAVPGIFRPVAVPKHPVQRQLSLRLQGEGIDATHELGTYTVYRSQVEALVALRPQQEADDAISYLKEQQWKVDFALAQATQGELRASVQATGVLRARADGEVYLSASSAGHLHSKVRFPYTGMQVERGQVLAAIIPRLGTGGDLATLKAALEKARSEYQLASHEKERLERLWKQKAVAKHRLHEAESAAAVAKAELDGAQRRYQQSAGGRQSAALDGIPVLAPIDGVLAQVNGAPGQYVHEGDPLFHIVNVDRLWLEVSIAEADFGKLQQPDGAWFSLEGFDTSFNTFDLGGRRVALGSVVDPVSRTVPLIFEFENPQQRLRVGMFANVRVFTGETRGGVVVPASAVFDDGGQPVIYVMLGGESFQRRMVTLGVRESDKVMVSGVDAGEWVVSRGAYQVRLASASPAQAGHGHAH